MAVALSLSALRTAVARATALPTRCIATSAARLSNPHGGEGTGYRDRERAEEARFIHEMEARRMEQLKKSVRDHKADAEELRRLAKSTERQSVKEFLEHAAEDLSKV